MRFLVASLLFSIPCIILSQTNLIQNPSFEEFFDCDYEVVSNPVENVLPGWYILQGFPRYFNEKCVDVPNNQANFYDELPHPPFDGDGILVVNTLSPFIEINNTVRQYLQTKLLEPLSPGKLYYIEYYITQTNETEYTHSHHAVHFTNEFETEVSNAPLALLPPILFDPLLEVDTISIKEQGVWARHYHCFTVDSDYSVMQVGNFAERDEISTTPSAGFSVPAIRTSYDNFFLAEVEPELLLDEYDEVVCAGDCITLSTNHSLIQGTFEWEFFGANIKSSTDSIVTVCYDTPGTYDVSLHVSHCSGEYDNNFPGAIMVVEGIEYDAPLDTSICFEDQVSVSLPLIYDVLWGDGSTDHTRSLQNEGSYTFELSNGVCSEAYAFDISHIVNPEMQETEIFDCQGASISFQGETYVEPGIYPDTLHNINGCDSVYSLLVFEYYEEIPLELEGDLFFCPDEEAVLNIPSTHDDIRWSNGGTGFEQSFDEEGVYSITAKDENKCDVERNFEIKALRGVSVSAEDLLDLDFVEGIPLQVIYEGEIIQYQWTGNQIALSCFDCPFPNLESPQAGVYTIEVVNEGGCFDLDQLLVSLNKISVYLPTAISKSTNNFENQLFFAQSNRDIPYSLQIFDRWGRLVYEQANLIANDLSQGWNPSEHNPDVFVYVIRYEDEEDEILLKGQVSVLD